VTAFPELCEEHRQLEAEAGRLKAIAMAAVPDAAAIAGMRWKMAQAIHNHCAREDADIYQAIFASGDAAATRAAWADRKEHGQLAKVFGTYVRDWPVARINAEWMAFRAATLAVIEKLAARIATEEGVLYPHAERVRMRRAA
jgi:hypothetical protein